MKINTIRIKSEYWEPAEPNGCLVNVEAIVAERGGEVVYGWSISNEPSYDATSEDVLYQQWNHHVVWRKSLRRLSACDQAGILLTMIPRSKEITSMNLPPDQVERLLDEIRDEISQWEPGRTDFEAEIPLTAGENGEIKIYILGIPNGAAREHFKK